MNAPTDTAISVSGLVKTFGNTRALDGLDLTVNTGEVHGFLGPNGSGKTTTIRVLLGLLRSDSGAARLLGGDPWRDATTLHRRRKSMSDASPSAAPETCGCMCTMSVPRATWTVHGIWAR